MTRPPVFDVAAKNTLLEKKNFPQLVGNYESLPLRFSVEFDRFYIKLTDF